MKKKKTHWFKKFIAVFFLFSTVISILWSNHFLLGSFLNIFRWIILSISLFLFWRFWKNKLHVTWSFISILIPLFLLVQFFWIKSFEASPIEHKGSNEITVMSYNVLFNNHAPEQCVSVIRNYNPDILLIQEYSTATSGYLKRALNNYPYKKEYPDRRTLGLAIFSKHPIRNSFLYPKTHLHPKAQIAEIAVGKLLIQVLNTHLGSPAVAMKDPDNFLQLYSENYKGRRIDWWLINEISLNNKKNISAQVFAGDFNTPRYEPLIEEIKSHWNDASEIGKDLWQPTFPNIQKMPPCLTLDYIFYKGAIELTDYKVIKEGSSDHFPILATFKL